MQKLSLTCTGTQIWPDCDTQNTQRNPVQRSAQHNHTASQTVWQQWLTCTGTAGHSCISQNQSSILHRGWWTTTTQLAGPYMHKHSWPGCVTRWPDWSPCIHTSTEVSKLHPHNWLGSVSVATNMHKSICIRTTPKELHTNTSCSCHHPTFTGYHTDKTDHDEIMSYSHYWHGETDSHQGVKTSLLLT